MAQSGRANRPIWRPEVALGVTWGLQSETAPDPATPLKRIGIRHLRRAYPGATEENHLTGQQ